MVRFQFDERNRVDFKVAGYQYPKIDDKDYDGNWLNIYIEVDGNIGKWKTVDACLLTWEIEGLIEEFDKAGRAEVGYKSDVEFIEPNLRFSLNSKQADEIEIRIEFRLESRPMSWSENEKCFLEGKFNKETVKSIKEGLEQELKRYPKKV